MFVGVCACMRACACLYVVQYVSQYVHEKMFLHFICICHFRFIVGLLEKILGHAVIYLAGLDLFPI